MTFTIEELYKVNRVDYCRLTGITPIDLITHLNAEITMLERSLDSYRHEYRISGSITTDQQRWRADIIKEISKNIEAKKLKVKDIKKDFCLK